jgi:hypothetical protein
MSFDGIRSIEWYAHNEVRAYPLAVTADGKSNDSSFTLPNAVLLAVYVHIPWSRDVDPSRFFVSQVINTGSLLEIVISYKPPADPAVNVARSQIIPLASTSPTVREIVPTEAWSDVAGSVTFGTSTSLVGLPLGVFNFNFDSTQLEVDCIRPSARNLSGLLIESAGDTFELATGTVNLRAGENIRLRVQETVDGGRDVWIDAISGLNLNVDCDCGDVLTNPVRTLNGIRPNVNGNIDINGAKCLNVEAATGVLSWDNPCSTPCCGCEEAEALQEAVNLFGPQINTLANFAPRLAAQMDRIEFFTQSTDIRTACDAIGDGNGGGLPPTITTTTTTTTSINALEMAAIGSYTRVGPVAGFAVDAVSSPGYTVNWQFSQAFGVDGVNNPLGNCTIDDILAGNCGDAPAAAGIGSAMLPVITTPNASAYQLNFNLAPAGSSIGCPGGTVDEPPLPLWTYVVGRVYVPAPLYVDVITTASANTGDEIRWGYRHRQIFDGTVMQDVDQLLTASANEPIRAGGANNVSIGSCVGEPWNGVISANSTATLNAIGKGYLLAVGWHDVVVIVKRSSTARSSSSITIRFDTHTACISAGATTRQYRLQLLNYSPSAPVVNFDLTTDSGAISPTAATSTSLRSGGLVVTVDASATEIIATSGSVGIVAAINSIPARPVFTGAMYDNYAIELTNIPGCS